MLYKLKIQLQKQLLGWCKAEGYKLLKEFDLRAAQEFRASWTDGRLAKKKKQERLTGFFWFSRLTSNPTDRLGRISVTQTPTDYFTRDEYDKLIDATYLYRENRGETIGGNNGTRIRALIMLMRWSGLRIRDAVTLERIRLINDNLLLYQAKTGTLVYVPLPPQVAEALRTVPDGVKPNPRYFFGAAMDFRRVLLQTGNAVLEGSSSWLAWKSRTAQQSAASHTC
jgi:integrase/recombinase XerD